jgi:hypothetical protein
MNLNSSGGVMRNRRECRLLPLLSAIVLSSGLTVVPLPAFGQASGWELEVHGGGALATNLSGGSTNLPTGTPLPTFVPQYPSRRVSTWFAGDGSALANTVASQFAIGSPFQFPARIAPLDGILDRPFAERQSGAGFGFRVSRTLTPRLAAEFNVDYVASSLSVPSEIATGIQDSATSFRDTFNGFLAFANTAQRPVTVTSSGSVEDGDGSQLLATGALTVNLATRGRVIPYVTGGAGIVSDRGADPTAQLEGQYGIQVNTVPIIEETDRVTLTYAADRKAAVGVFGGGARVFLSERAGVRVDVRVHVSSRSVRTLLNATPDVRIAPPELADGLLLIGNPSLVFVNNPTIVGFASSLSGQPLSGFEAYEVSGIVSQTVFSAGYFWRF